jgi:hypothetical protein
MTESFDCFLWTNRRWSEDFKKFRSNAINNCRILLRLAVNEGLFDDPRPKFYQKTAYYNWICVQFFDHVRSLLSVSKELEGFEVSCFAGRLKPGSLN